MKGRVTKILSNLRCGFIDDYCFDPIEEQSGDYLAVPYTEFLLDFLQFQPSTSPFYVTNDLKVLMDANVDEATEQEMEEFIALIERFKAKLDLAFRFKNEMREFENATEQIYKELENKRPTKRVKK